MNLKVLRLTACVFIFGAGAANAAYSPLVSGNGFGLIIVSSQPAALTRFYAHPYRYAKSDPKDALSEGIETANFLNRLAWEDPSGGNGAGEARYMADSHIIAAKDAGGDQFYFMPFGLRRNAVIAARSSSGGYCLRPEWAHPVASQDTVTLSGVRLLRMTFKDVEETLLIVPFDGNGAFIGNRDACLAGSSAWALISAEKKETEAAAAEFSRWRAGLAAGALIERELKEIEAWRVKPRVTFVSEAERRLWRQSEIILRMAQSREPNRPGRYNNGLIAATLGYWFHYWVRDMSYAALALSRMGHKEEARAAVEAYFNARPVGKMIEETGGLPYQVSVVRYFGDGSEEPFFTQEGSTNIEFDGWGLVLWVLGDYVERTGDTGILSAVTYRGTVYAGAKEYILNPLLAKLEPYGGGLIVAKDTSIWEERQKDAKHFAFTTAAAIQGLRKFVPLAVSAGDGKTAGEVREKLALLEKGFAAAYVRGGRLRGTLEEGVKNEVDGASIFSINFGIVTDPAVIRNAIEEMAYLRVDSGGYRRVRSTYEYSHIYEYWYEREEFLLIDFSLAEVYLRAGEPGKAAAILSRIVEKSAMDNNNIPEMYVAVDCKLFPGRLGDPTGAIPVVGYGAGAYVLHLLEREALTVKK